MRILAIETSCDETAASLVEVVNYSPKVITNIVASQVNRHATTGGVVPELAARLHTENLPWVLQQATDAKRLGFEAVAVTVGPGLVGSLLLGVAAAKTIASTLKKPLYAINHLEGHIYSAWLTSQAPELPALALIASGGHTELIYLPRHLYYQQLGATRDDAAGEAFDKVARLLGLPYPGGPAIAQLALQGDEQAFSLPTPLDESDNLEFSFSGLKAAVAHLVKQLPSPLSKQQKVDLAASFQATVTKIMITKTVTALQHFPDIKSVCLVGGVAANQYLRHHLEQAINQLHKGYRFIVPPSVYCTDNAAMIGAAAVFRHLFARSDPWYDVDVDPNLKLAD